MNSVDKAIQTMIDNMPEKTGKSLEEWFGILNKQSFQKHGEFMNFLKKEHGVTHGFANMIVQFYKKNPKESEDDLVESQYQGKENLRPIYDLLISEIQKLGSDIELAPKKAYVSVRRKRQFAILQPSTKIRFDLGLNLKGKDPEGKLEAAGSWNTMCTHRIRINPGEDVGKDIFHWLKEAYDNAG